MNRTFIVLALLITVIGASTYLYAQRDTHMGDSEVAHVAAAGDAHAVTLYKDPNCGCCEGYAAALRTEGYVVTVKSTRDMASIKEQYNIPPHGESCHTSIIDGYVVEGHVPLEAVEKLLTERPSIAGIGLARMPAGTPGMPGVKRAPYEIYELSATGETSPYLSL